MALGTHASQVSGRPAPSVVPKIDIRFDPPGPEFAISEFALMPEITAIATLPSAGPSPASPLHFRWRVTLRFSRPSCQHAMGKVTEHPVITVTTFVPNLTIPFKLVRGGELSVSVETTIGTQTLRGESTGLSIVGTNPSIASLVTATTGAPPIFRKLMRLESQLRQFRAPNCPLFSADNQGGVGLCQITPPDSDDQIWDWKANVQGGLAVYREKEKRARRYPDLVRNGATFKKQVADYNKVRQAQAAVAAQATDRPVPTISPVAVTVPDYTPEQLQLDTVRGYNGFAGGLHEYRLRTDERGLLVVHLDKGERNGTAEWQRISAAERARISTSGDPNYVDDVLRQSEF